MLQIVLNIMFYFPSEHVFHHRLQAEAQDNHDRSGDQVEGEGRESGSIQGDQEGFNILTGFGWILTYKCYR